MTIKLALKLILVALGVFLLSARASAEERLTLKTQKEMEAYAMGVELVRNWKRQGIDLDLDVVIRGMKDVQAGNRLLLSDNDLRTAMGMFTSELRRKQAEVRLVTQQDNKKKGEEFLAKNKTKEGVVTLPSGLQYKIIKAAEGEKPADANTVECNYRGTHIDGTEFDSSYRKGGPEAFKVSQVIPGWREALKLMPLGSKWQLFIPPELAYGQRGSGQIGPNETIIFEIELVAIE